MRPIVIADGLSALAVHRHAAPLLKELSPRLAQEQWRLAPLTVVLEGRVAIGDEIGELLGAQLVILLIGERPGLTSPDSLGAYLTWDPHPGRSDGERNCISNIRPEGLAPIAAGDKLLWLIDAMRRLRLTGVGLKDEQPGEPPPMLIDETTTDAR